MLLVIRKENVAGYLIGIRRMSKETFLISYRNVTGVKLQQGIYETGKRIV